MQHFFACDRAGNIDLLLWNKNLISPPGGHFSGQGIKIAFLTTKIKFVFYRSKPLFPAI